MAEADFAKASLPPRPFLDGGASAPFACSPMGSRSARTLLCLLLLALRLAVGGAFSARPDDSSAVSPPCPDWIERVAVTASTGLQQQQQQGVEDATQSGHPCSIITDACFTLGDAPLEDHQRWCPTALPLKGGTVAPSPSAEEHIFQALLVILIVLFTVGPLIIWKVCCLCKRKSLNRTRTNLRHANMISRYLAHVQTDNLRRHGPAWTPGMPPPLYTDQPPSYGSEDPKGNRSSLPLSPAVHFRRSNEDGEAEAAICPPVPRRDQASLDSGPAEQTEPLGVPL